MIRILLVEDNNIVRRLMQDMINQQFDLEVTGLAADGLAALALLSNGLQTDIVLADLNMPGMDGIELTMQLLNLYDHLKIVVLTMHARGAFLKRALAAGARGYLLKNGDMEELYSTIRKVHDGEVIIGAEVTS